jgi:hypothetical protein
VATLAHLPVPVLERVGDPESLRDEWSELASRSGNIFATPEWLLLWWEHFGGGRELLLTAGRGAGGGLETLLPFYVWRHRPLRIVRVIGHWPGDELGPIGERDVAGPAFARWGIGRIAGALALAVLAYYVLAEGRVSLGSARWWRSPAATASGCCSVPTGRIAHRTSTRRSSAMRS